jgi:organic radical activating enzyme
MFNLDYSEFYITNVCNLNCPRCNRYNNYAFSGHLDWEDHAEDYRQWSKKLNISCIGILGGEPLLNPGLAKWIRGLAETWPTSSIQILTNGTQFDRWPGLYDLLSEYRGRIRINVNRHNAEQTPNILSRIEKFYPGPYRKYYVNPDRVNHPKDGYFTQSPDHSEKFKFTDQKYGFHIWDDPTYEFSYCDNNSILVKYGVADSFDNVAVGYDPSTVKLSLTHMSDPDRAAGACFSKWSHHFFQGRLYKCGVTAVLPEFIKQFPVSMTDQQRDIVNGYQAAEHTWSDEQLASFLVNLQQGHSIEQCRLCPENPIAEPFAAGHKKIPIKKLQRI